MRIATMEGLGSFYLGSRIQLFYERHPSVLIELVTSSHWINLSKREADIFISFTKPAERRLSMRKVGEFKISLYASEDYLRRKGFPQTKSDLNHHEFVDYIDDLIQIQAVRWLADIFSPRQVVFRSTSLIAQYASASSGLGIANLPTFVAAHNPSLCQVLPTLCTKREIWLSVHKDLEHVSRVNAVTRFLSEQFSRDQEFMTGA